MSCQVDLQSWLESAHNFVSRLLRLCLGWMPCLQGRRQIHPTATDAFAYSQFIQLSSQRRIRVIHIDSRKYKSNSWQLDTQIESMTPKLEEFHYNAKLKSLSLVSNSSELSSEEYWFTRWNRPLRLSESCNCVFRKSWRNSFGASAAKNTQKEELKDIKDNLLNKSLVLGICDNETDEIHSSDHNLVCIESFVEELLQEVWNEVFVCVSEIECKKKACQFELKANHLCTSVEDDDSEMKFVCRMKNSELNDFNCQTFISCHQSENTCHVIETVNVEGMNQDPLLNAEFKSVGCVNPTFLGTNTNPDLLDYVVAYETTKAGCDLPDYDGDYAKYLDDTDSGFNTVSLESTNQQTNEVDCSVISKSDNETEWVSKTQTGSYNVNINDIHLNVSEFHIANNTVCDDKFEAKDDTEKYNQTYLTSLYLQLKDSCKVQDNCTTGSDSKSKKIHNQSRGNKQCYHKRNLRRLKPLLYFLHGVGCSADLWSALIQHFAAAGYEILAPDMLGHGYSNAPDNASAYTFHRLLKDVIDIFDRFVGENRKCVVIGHAYGCSLAAALARYRAQQVSHLVLISGGGPAPLAPRTADSRPPSVSPCLLACMKPLLMCGFRRNILYAPCGKHIESCPSMSKGVPHYVLEHVAQGQDWPEGDATFHRRILVPTLLVHGLQDPYVTLVQECEMERTIPRSFLELIPEAGHLSMLETPTKLSHMINCFIDWWSR